MCLICHSSTITLIPVVTQQSHNSHTTVRWTCIVSYRSASTQSSWKFFISDKRGVLYIIRTKYALLLDLLFLEHKRSLIFLVHICHLDGCLSRRVPPNVQATFDLLLGRSDASPTLFLLVRLSWDVYFPQVDHICSMVSYHELVNGQCLACLQYFFPSRRARLTVLLIIACQLNLILINP